MRFYHVILKETNLGSFLTVSFRGSRGLYERLTGLNKTLQQKLSKNFTSTKKQAKSTGQSKIGVSNVE